MPRRSIRRNAKRRTKRIKKVIGGADKPTRPARPARPAPLNPDQSKGALEEEEEIQRFKTKLHQTNFDVNQMFVISIMADVIYSLASGNDISRKNLNKILAIKQYA
uniref:Uncharacterized protein n=1 Tax=viral metagenome TaxID=1070528 RepID=A0A6C0CD76_9ZZZZ